MDDQTFGYRLAGGLAFFAVMELRELSRFGWRKGVRSARSKEYGFLFVSAAVGIVYALVHDGLTYALEPAYFTVVKGLDTDGFFPAVALLAAQAGWSAGLAVGLGLLVANNPVAGRDQLGYRRLAALAARPVLGALGVAGAAGVGAELAPAEWTRIWRLPDAPHFVTVWSIHVGTYVGGGLGLIAAVLRVRAERHGAATPVRGSSRGPCAGASPAAAAPSPSDREAGWSPGRRR